MNRILVSVLSAVLLLSACGSEKASVGGLDAITVSKASTPKVTVAEGFATETTETKVIEEGGGEAVKAGDTVKVNYLAVNGRTGKQFDSSYAAGAPATFTLDKASILQGFITALENQKIGSRVVVAISPKDGFGQDRKELELMSDDTMVFVFDLVSKVPTEAKGESETLPSNLPELVLDAKDQPEKFVANDDTRKEQTKQSAHVVIQGDGPAVKADQTLSVHYVGQVYPSGKVFDSSWSRGTPASFQLTKGQLIDCWTDLLAGQKVGSRVVLVCPSDTAYGDEGREPDIKGGDTLVFAIDLLDAS
ncbi:MAG: FKBP-type peptidyl-prolyl cis-trans isomerase [Aeromicrobium sp.]|uniref:FKBP-type peptidyl-prolyl cis-trans isomerase n=1 Tax=Aeromicrobium sp. TaxID=1871063 RepID=UPI003C5AF663